MDYVPVTIQLFPTIGRSINLRIKPFKKYVFVGNSKYNKYTYQPESPRNHCLLLCWNCNNVISAVLGDGLVVVLLLNQNIIKDGESIIYEGDSVPKWIEMLKILFFYFLFFYFCFFF